MPDPLPVIITTDLDEAGPSTPHVSPPSPAASTSTSPLPPDTSHLAPGGALGLHPQPHRSHSPTSSWGSSQIPPSPTLTTASSVHFTDETPITPRGSVRREPRVAGTDDGRSTTDGAHLRDWGSGAWADDATSVGKAPRAAEEPHPPGVQIKKHWWRRSSSKKGDEDGKSEHGESSGESGKDKDKVEAVRIDPDNDATDPAPFREKPSRLAMLVDPKSIDELERIGGVDGLLDGLGVNAIKGLGAGGGEGAPRSSGDVQGSGPQWAASMEERRRVYGQNDLPERQSKSIWLLMWLAFKDKVLDLGTQREITYSDQCPDGCEAPAVDWVEGVAIMVAIIIVVLVGSVNDWQKERQFKKLNEKREDRTVKVLRGGNEQVVNVRDVVVGDIALVEPGEVVPVDGVFLRGHGVRCDESGATGESDAIKKLPYAECIAERDGAAPGQRLKKDCFMISGAKVLEGVGEYVVTSVGKLSFNGRIMMAMRGGSEETPLQVKLNYLAELIAKAGGGSGLILFVALMIRFFVQLAQEPGRSANDKAQSFINILIISVTLVVVAVPEGLPLAVTLALAFATKRMTRENLLVRVLGSCETMGHATVVCTDKTGTLTQNVMAVVVGSLGVHGKFVKDLRENASRSNANDVEGDAAQEAGGGGDGSRAGRDDFAFDMADFNAVASPELQTVLNEAICINSTAFEDKDEDGNVAFVGSKTETALLRFAKDMGWADWRKTREQAEVVQMIPFSSELKAMGVVVKHGDRYRLYLKGASEILTRNCAEHIVVHEPGNATGASGAVETAPFSTEAMNNISKTIIFYADQTLRTIALCYRDFEQWPPRGAEGRAADDVPYDLIARDMVLLAVTGIEDPLRPGVSEAVRACQGAGVQIKMCTGDNVLTARSIAAQCGIFTPGGIVMEGPVFRKRLDVVQRLQILARSSPEDKRLLVQTLKSMGEVVGVTGDGTNDGPALKMANVGFAMGIAGTEVAKEASDIILMDDSFSNIVLAVMWGRCVNDSVKKFLQFQISVNITAVVITFVSAVASNSEESVLSAVQLLWVNLIMDTFAALALATDPATRTSLDRKPDRKDAPLISVDMIKMIVVQAVYQVIVCLVLHFAGRPILHMTGDAGDAADLRTLVFNCFVFCQIFNQLNCRRLDRHFNVLEGFFRNYWFIGIFLIMVGGQILIVEVGGAAFQVQRIGGRDWGISLIVGLLSLPLGALVRLCPTAPVERFLVRAHLYPDPNKLPVVAPGADDDEPYEYNPALSRVKDNLHTYARIRGGRLRASSMVAKSRAAQLRQADIQPSSLLAMVPTLVAGGVGAGAHWVAHAHAGGGRAAANLSDPARDPSRSTAELFAGKIQLHPDTDPSDPLYAKFGITPPTPMPKLATLSPHDGGDEARSP